MINITLQLMGGGRLVADYKKFQTWHKKSFLSMFFGLPEFRYLFFYRLRTNSLIFRILLKPLQLFNCHNLFIGCSDIGGGLFIEHGFSTIISCAKMGENCMIEEQVTIGWKSIIGNNVKIRTGAFIKDRVVISNDVIIGAGAVVIRDVPPHSIVVGTPARVIKTRNSESEPWIEIS